MGVEVVGDLAHVAIDEPADVRAEALLRRGGQHRQHVAKRGVIGIDAVGAPHNHRHAARLALRYPTDVVRSVLTGEGHGLTQVAPGLR